MITTDITTALLEWARSRQAFNENSPEFKTNTKSFKEHLNDLANAEAALMKIALHDT